MYVSSSWDRVADLVCKVVSASFLLRRADLAWMVRFAATASLAVMSRVVIREVKALTCVSNAEIKVRRFAISVSCWVIG